MQYMAVKREQVSAFSHAFQRSPCCSREASSLGCEPVARQSKLHCCAANSVCVMHVGMCGYTCGECRHVGGAMHGKESRGLHTPWAVVLSGNVGVGPLVALWYWFLIIRVLDQPQARSEYGHFGAIPICCWNF